MDNTENRDTIDWLKPENRFRATSMDLFRQGLRTQNWEAIAAAYLMLTGEKIEVARRDAVEISVPSEKEQIVLLQPDSPEPIQVMPEPPKRKRGRPRKNPLPVKAEDTTPAGVNPLFADCVAPAKAPGAIDKVFTKSRQHDCKPHQNIFKDDCTEATDEIVKDREVPSAILNAKRPPTNNVKVRCQQCGRVEDVDPSLLPFGLRLTKDYTMRYLCNGCIVGARTGIDLEATSADEPLYEPEE
jgi:hypothetical protein